MVATASNGCRLIFMETMATAAVKITKTLRNQVAATADGGPDLGTWLKRVEALDVPVLDEAVEGIWCGRSGRVTQDLPGLKSMLCMGWYNGRVEFCYLS